MTSRTCELSDFSMPKKPEDFIHMYYVFLFYFIFVKFKQKPVLQKSQATSFQH